MPGQMFVGRICLNMQCIEMTMRTFAFQEPDIVDEQCLRASGEGQKWGQLVMNFWSSGISEKG